MVRDAADPADPVDADDAGGDGVPGPPPPAPVRGRGLSWTALGLVVILAGGAAGVSISTAPSPLAQARSQLPANDPAASAALAAATRRTLAAPSFTLTIQTPTAGRLPGGATPKEVVDYQAPDRVAISGPTGLTEVAIGSTTYTALPPGAACNGWRWTALSSPGNANMGRDILQALFSPEELHPAVRASSPDTFEVDGVEEERVPPGFHVRSSLETVALTATVVRGRLVSETVRDRGAFSLRERIVVSRIGTSTPVTAPPAEEVGVERPGSICSFGTLSSGAPPGG